VLAGDGSDLAAALQTIARSVQASTWMPPLPTHSRRSRRGDGVDGYFELEMHQHACSGAQGR